MGIESIGEILDGDKVQGKEKTALEFLLDAISDFPVYGLESVDEYVIAVKQLLGKSIISIQDLINYSDSFPTGDENEIWYKTSVVSLIHSMEVMHSFSTLDDFVADLKNRTYRNAS